MPSQRHEPYTVYSDSYFTQRYPIDIIQRCKVCYELWPCRVEKRYYFQDGPYDGRWIRTGGHQFIRVPIMREMPVASYEPDINLDSAIRVGTYQLKQMWPSFEHIYIYEGEEKG